MNAIYFWDAGVGRAAVRELQLWSAAAALEGNVSQGEMLIKAASVARTQSARVRDACAR